MVKVALILAQPPRCDDVADMARRAGFDIRKGSATKDALQHFQETWLANQRRKSNDILSWQISRNVQRYASWEHMPNHLKYVTSSARRRITHEPKDCESLSETMHSSWEKYFFECDEGALL
eukprot:3056823-Amphidinium_carterae.1